MLNQILLVIVTSVCSFSSLQAHELSNKLLSLSEQLLYRVKTDAPIDSVQTELKKYSSHDLLSELTNDTSRKVFWINIYNAYYQTLATQQKAKPKKLFSVKAIHFTDVSFSLDEVEHGILRKYRWKLSLGYLPQFLPKPIIKQLAVSVIDYRIHFALNCGAKSCPPIAFYRYDNLDEQLDLATSSFLEAETEINETSRTVQITKLMQWFKADFGGTKGIKNILTNFLHKDFTHYKVKYKRYDWSKSLKNFK